MSTSRALPLAAPAARGRLPARTVLPALIAHTLRRQRRAPLTWGLPLGLMGTLVVAIYPSIADTLSKAIEDYPAALKEAFRIERIDTAAAYLDAEMLALIVPLAVAVFAIRALVAAVAGAERSGTLDVLLANPVSRREHVAAAFVGTALTSLAILAVVGALAWLPALAFGVDLALADVAAGVLNVWPLALFFGAVGLLCAALVPRPGTATGVGAALLVTMYLVEVLGNLSDALGSIAPLSVFHHYGSAIQDGIDWTWFGVVTLLALALAVAAAALFERRDIRA